MVHTMAHASACSAAHGMVHATAQHVLMFSQRVPFQFVYMPCHANWQILCDLVGNCKFPFALVLIELLPVSWCQMWPCILLCCSSRQEPVWTSSQLADIVFWCFQVHYATQVRSLSCVHQHYRRIAQYLCISLVCCGENHNFQVLQFSFTLTTAY
jgi:hypothetical protein